MGKVEGEGEKRCLAVILSPVRSPSRTSLRSFIEINEHLEKLVGPTDRVLVMVLKRLVRRSASQRRPYKHCSAETSVCLIL